MPLPAHLYVIFAKTQDRVFPSQNMIYKICISFPTNSLNIAQSIKRVLSIGSRAVPHHDITSGSIVYNPVESLPAGTICQLAPVNGVINQPDFQRHSYLSVPPKSRASLTFLYDSRRTRTWRLIRARPVATPSRMRPLRESSRGV